MFDIPPLCQQNDKGTRATGISFQWSNFWLLGAGDDGISVNSESTGVHFSLFLLHGDCCRNLLVINK